MWDDPATRINRPRQIYTGATERKYSAPINTKK
jgi:citrate synthase